MVRKIDSFLHCVLWLADLYYIVWFWLAHPVQLFCIPQYG